MGSGTDFLTDHSRSDSNSESDVEPHSLYFCKNLFRKEETWKSTD